MQDLFGSFRARGMGRGAQYRALESVSGGNLKAWQLEALVDSLGTEGGLKTLKREGEGDYQANYIARVVGDGNEPNWLKAGQEAVGQGDWRSVKMEGMQMKVGDTVAKVMDDMTDSLVNLAKTGQNLLNLDFEGMVRDISGSIKDLTGAMEKASHPGGWLNGAVRGSPESANAAAGRHQTTSGMFSAADEGLVWDPASRTMVYSDYANGGSGQSP